ncbi:MAG TPA: glycine--tRNA ligase, partial [Chthoniobacterales bacterium]
MEKIVSLCKRRGFIFQASEIYGGLNGVWDYGPLGVELKRNLKDYWWRVMVRERDDVVGLDGSILTHRAVLKASGHEDTFSDPMVDCRTCKARLRVDQLPEKNGVRQCPNCGGRDLTEARPFNLMFSTQMGASADPDAIAYLRPETAQSIFVQFKNVLDTARKKLPFGIAQIGKAFRNEINPRNYIFRSREFEQMELEYFCRPEQGMELLEYWKEERLKFYQDIGIPREKLHVLTVPDADRAFYSKGTYDIEYEFPFGLQELEGVAYRTDYDLAQHQKASSKPLDYFDEETRQRFTPHVIEPSAGVDRTILALICEAFAEETVTDEKGKSETRIVLRFHPRIAPIKAGIFPLLKNQPALVEKARKVQTLLRPHMNVFYDETGAIGRRYRRQDEAGTPFGITVDFESLGEHEP